MIYAPFAERKATLAERKATLAERKATLAERKATIELLYCNRRVPIDKLTRQFFANVFFANVYLSPLDHFVKHKRRSSIHRDKYRLLRIACGVDFPGYVAFADGRVRGGNWNSNSNNLHASNRNNNSPTNENNNIGFRGASS